MILDDIIKERSSQIEREKALFASDEEFIKQVEKIDAPALDFKAALKKPDTIAIIAEVKKASPSKGIISADFDPVKTAALYEKSGAAAISVLTEEKYFMGANAYLEQIKQTVSIPVLRKDFIIDPFQIYHARLLRADAILLIAAALNKKTMAEFIQIAESLSLYVLAEAHNEDEVYLTQEAGATIIGINNRDLKTFSVDLSVTERLIQRIDSAYVKVSESGITNADDIKTIKSYGADAALIGETLMKTPDVGMFL